MISLSICFVEIFYWMLTGGHCFEHLVTEKGLLACTMIVPLEIIVEYFIGLEIVCWRDK